MSDDTELATAESAKSITVAICAENSIKIMKEFCSRFHSLGIKHIGCNVKGVSGFVCDDFLSGFQVVDSDGEFSREVRKLNLIFLCPYHIHQPVFSWLYATTQCASIKHALEQQNVTLL